MRSAMNSRLDEIHLVERDYQRFCGAKAQKQFRIAVIFGCRRLRSVKNPEDGIGFFQRVMRRGNHIFAQARARLVNAGSIDKQYLRLGRGVDAQLAPARRLWFGRDNGDLLTDQRR